MRNIQKIGEKKASKFMIMFVLLASGISTTAAGTLVTSSELSWQMGNTLSGVDREIYLIDAQQNGVLEPGNIWLGTYANGAIFYQDHKQKSEGHSSTSQITIPTINFQVAATINDQLLAFVQAQASNLLKSKNEGIKVPNAYAIYHQNIAQNTQFYALAGRKDIDFGSFANLVTTTSDVDLSNLVQKYFQANGNVIGAGFLSHGFNGIISWINGGQANNTNLYTTNQNQMNNFAVNLSYMLGEKQTHLKLGAGYLNGSLATLQRPGSKTNPAYDINISALLNQFELMAEYASTFYTTAFTGKIGSALTTGGAYHFTLDNKATVLALQYSWANASFYPTDTTASSDQNSYSIELRNEFLNNLWLGAQVNYIINPVGIVNVNELSARLMAEVVF